MSEALNPADQAEFDKAIELANKVKIVSCERYKNPKRSHSKLIFLVEYKYPKSDSYDRSDKMGVLVLVAADTEAAACYRATINKKLNIAADHLGITKYHRGWIRFTHLCEEFIAQEETTDWPEFLKSCLYLRFID